MDDDVPPARLMVVSIERNLIPDHWVWQILVENRELFRGFAYSRSDARSAAYDRMFTMLELGWY
jgi:hypothetical protein